MDRKEAELFYKIYKHEKKQGRSFYPEDLTTARILSRAECKPVVEEFKNKGFLVETVNRGANTYSISRKGLSQMFAYRDLRIEAMSECL